MDSLGVKAGASSIGCGSVAHAFPECGVFYGTSVKNYLTREDALLATPRRPSLSTEPMVTPQLYSVPRPWLPKGAHGCAGAALDAWPQSQSADAVRLDRFLMEV